MEEGINFKTVVTKISALKKYLLSKWKFIILSFLFGGALGFTISFFSTPQYVAESTVLIGASKGGLGGALRMAQSLGIGIGGGGDGMTFSTENAADIVKSNRILINTLLATVEIDGKKDKLANFYLDWFGMREKWIEKKKKALIDFKFTGKEAFKLTFREDSIMQKILPRFKGKSIAVKGDIKTSMVDIAVTTKNEKFSYYFAHELLEAISHFYLDESIAKEKRTFQMMQDKTDSIYTEMTTRERALARIKDQSFRNVMMQGMVPQLQLQRDIEILNVMYSLALKNVEMARMTMTEKQPVFQIVDEPVLPLMIDRISPLIATAGLAILFTFLAIGYLIMKKAIRNALNS